MQKFNNFIQFMRGVGGRAVIGIRAFCTLSHLYRVALGNVTRAYMHMVNHQISSPFKRAILDQTLCLVFDMLYFRKFS